MGDPIPIRGSISVTGNKAGVEYAAKAIPREPVDPIRLNTDGGSDIEEAPELELLSIIKDIPDVCSEVISTCDQCT